MDRRSFLAASVGSFAAQFLPPEDEPVVIQAPPLPKSGHGLLKFGELALLFTDTTALQVNTPFHACYITGHKHLDRMTTVTVKKLIAPKSVWEEVFKNYADVTKASSNPPLVIEVMGHKVGTFDLVIFQAVGISYHAQDMVMCEDVTLMGQWREMREAMDKYEEAQRNDPEVIAEKERLAARERHQEEMSDRATAYWDFDTPGEEY